MYLRGRGEGAGRRPPSLGRGSGLVGRPGVPRDPGDDRFGRAAARGGDRRARVDGTTRDWAHADPRSATSPCAGAIGDGDADRAEATMRRHVLDFEEVMRRVLTGS